MWFCQQRFWGLTKGTEIKYRSLICGLLIIVADFKKKQKTMLHSIIFFMMLLIWKTTTNSLSHASCGQPLSDETNTICCDM